MDRKTSLCIYLRSLSDATKLVARRIVDLDTIDGTLHPVEIAKGDAQSEESYPKVIKVRSGSSERILEFGYSDWWLSEHGVYHSEPNSSYTVYEVTFPLSSKDCDIRSEFKDGIVLPQGIGNQFFIVFDKDDERYEAIFCKKSDFCVRNGKYYVEDKIADLVHTTHYWNKYWIQKNKVYPNREDNIICGSDFLSLERYILLDTQTGSPHGRFYVYDFNDYFPLFISKFLRQRHSGVEYTKAQIKKIAEIIEQSLSDAEYIKSFFLHSGYELDEVHSLLRSRKDDILSYFQRLDDIDSVLLDVFRESEEISDAFIKCAAEKWLSQKNEERTQIENKMNELNKTLQQVNNQIDDRKTELDRVVEAIKFGEEQLIEQTKQHDSIKLGMSEYLADFDMQVHSKVNDIILFKNMFAQSENSGNQVRVHIYRNNDDDGQYESIECDSYGELEALLSYNLRAAGFQSQYSEDMSRFFLSMKYFGCALALSGSFYMQFADTVSRLYEGKPAVIVTVPTGYQDIAAIVDAIVSVQETVVVVENVIDSFSDCKVLFC